MNLQDLRDELETHAAGQHAVDVLPGVRQKIRRTKQRRTAGAFGAVAVLAAIAAGLVPTLHSATPDPAHDVPRDYTRDGLTVPGTVGDDKLLKAWIGDRGEDRPAFAWTPTTDSITVHANCTADGAEFAIRFKINDWYVGDASCLSDPSSWTIGSSVSLRPDSPFWLTSPVGKPAQVSADLIDLATRKVVTAHARIAFGIYSTPATPTDGANGAPARRPVGGPNDYAKDGVVYRRQIGGDTLAAAKVADPGRNEVRFSFTSTGRPLVLHAFCTANAGSDGEESPYSVSLRVGPGAPTRATCEANSTDAGVGNSLTIASPVPAGQRVEVVAQITPNGPPDVRLGLGIYFQGAQRTVDGVQLPEQIERGGYDYRLADVRTATGPSKTLTMTTPTGTPYVVAYGSSPLGDPGEVIGTLRVGKNESAIGAGRDSGGALGTSYEPHAAAPADHATLTVSAGEPTKGELILAIYLPV
ncbi:hypothetical protein [Kribbella sp. NPDC004875]|uniref:hypothetical protein n=1 Tax=Kribbella sp. NPDC004875 TaxID=3364107 RepID=UPI0036C2B282